MATASNSTYGDVGDIDLMGWDTVFALTLDALNKSIVSQKTTPPAFSGKDTAGGAACTGTWGPWQVQGGEGNGIIMSCPVVSGTLTTPGMPDTPLDGAVVEVMITLVPKAASQQLNDPTAKTGTGTTQNLLANQTTDEFEQPRVQSIKGIPGSATYPAEAAFNAYFQNNLAEFDAVFAAVRLEEEAIEANKQWLKPAFSTYALASPGSGGGSSGSQADSAFALLSLVNAPTGQLPQQNFDLRMFQVFASTATATNSVFAVSAALAIQNIVLQAAKQCVMGASDDDFEIANDGITITNKNQLTWGNFQLTANDPSSVVQPIISPGNFQLTLDGMNFHLSVSQAEFTSPDGTCDIKLTADQYFNIEAAKRSDDHYYLLPSPGLGTNSIRADVSPNKGFEIAMIIESIAVGIIFAFIGGALGDALGPAASTAVEEGEGVVSATAQDLDEHVGQMSEEEITEAENNGIQDATESVRSGGESNGGRTGIFSNKYKIWGGVIGGMFAIPVGLLPQIMQMVWADKITEGNVPTIDDFATNFSAAIQWPYVESWQVTGGTFRSAFLLGGSAQ